VAREEGSERTSAEPPPDDAAAGGGSGGGGGGDGGDGGGGAGAVVNLGHSVMIVLATLAVRPRRGGGGRCSELVTGQRTYVFWAADAGRRAYWLTAGRHGA